MPNPTSKSKSRRALQAKRLQEAEPVDPVWLVKAIGIALVAAFICAYITFCLLFYQGQWQLVLHPVRTSTTLQSIGGAPYELIHFGPDESAIPQLTGWWIPSQPNGRYAGTTLLFLPGANGSLIDSATTLVALHGLGINIFAFDYRGYGQSAATHPNQRKMTHDAEAAWLYLTGSRHIPASRIVPYGTGVGASLATHLAATHADIAALILDSPSGDLLDAALNDPRSKFIPVRMLFHERFPLAAPLSTLRTPKLLISYTKESDAVPPAFRTASEPRITVEMATNSDASYAQAITRFLDQYRSAATPDKSTTR